MPQCNKIHLIGVFGAVQQSRSIASGYICMTDMHSCRKHRDNSATRDVGSAVGQGEVKDWRSTEIYKRQKIVTYYVCFYSSTMLTSKITTEIIENHSEFSGCLNSCNIFV